MPELAGRRVLVTGATGFVGGSLVPALLARGAQVHALVRDASRAADVRTTPPGPARPGTASTSTPADGRPDVFLHFADLADPGSVRDAVAAVRPEVVIHLACARGESTAEERENLWCVNALGTVALLDAAAPAGCVRFVNAGSSLEYGLLGGAFRESDPTRPVTAFGASKLAGTATVSQGGLSGRLESVTLRLFSVYGPGEPSKRLVPTAIRSALLGETLPLTPAGPVRDFVFVGDVVDALIRAAELPELPSAGAVYNVGTGFETSNEALVDAVEIATDRRIARDVGAYAAHATDRAVWRADTTLAREEFGWHAATPLADGLAAHVAAVRAELELAR